MKMIQVVLVDWMGYPIYRKKSLGPACFHCGIGRLLKRMKRFDAGVDFECTVVLNRCESPSQPSLLSKACRIPGVDSLLFNRPETNRPEKYAKWLSRFPFVKDCLYRDNRNQDIGAYDFFLSRLREIGFEGDVLFANSSVRGPSENGWLAKYSRMFNETSEIGLCGVSLNSHDTTQRPPVFRPHLQSFFLYTNTQVLQQVFPNGLLESETALDKRSLVREGEIGISTRILDAGFGLRCNAYPNFVYRKGFDWRIPEGDLRYSKTFAHLANRC